MTDIARNTEGIYGLLSRLTSEDLPDGKLEIEIFNRYNELQRQVNYELLDLLEETSYPGKYQLFEQIRLLLLSVRLYSVIPDLIHCQVTGFYQPDEKTVQWLQNHFLDDSLKAPLLTKVPTLLTHQDRDDTQRAALTVSERTVEIGEDEYRELTTGDEHSENNDENLDFSSVMHLFHVKSGKIPPGRAFLFFPKNYTGQRNFDRVIFNLCDELVLSSRKKITKKMLSGAYENKENDVWSNLLDGSHVKSLLVDARTLKPDEQVPATINLGEFTADIQMFSSKGELLSKLTCDAQKRHNYYHALLLETIFSKLFWHLSVERRELNEQFDAVNKDSLTQDNELHTLVKKLQGELKKELERSDEQYRKCLKICGEMEEKLRTLELIRGIEEGPLDWNNHALSSDGLLGHFFRMCVFYRAFTGNNSNSQRVRDLEALCKNCADEQLAVIIANDYFQLPSSQSYLEHLGHYISYNPFIERLRILHCSDLGLSEEDCGARIASKDFPPPITAQERRMIGKYLLKKGDRDGAKRELYEAMAQGDKEAGIMYYKSFQQEVWDDEDAALFGVAAAARIIGRTYMARWQSVRVSTELFASALKFFNIAAANGDAQSYYLLSKLWFERGMQLGEYSKDGKDCFRASINALYTAPPLNAWESDDYERMGRACFYLGEYRTSMNHLKHVNTPDSLFLQGHMYEQGLGTRKNRITALARYQSAKERGHTQANGCYLRLNQELEKERKRKEASERQSYTEIRTTSNHSTSDGW